MDTKPANFIDKTQEMANDRKLFFFKILGEQVLYIGHKIT